MAEIPVSGSADLRGQVAIVTGAARGIGRACALALAGAGADVAGLDLKPPGDTARAVRELGRRALALACDVTQPTQVQSAIQSVLQELGRIDVLVNNAGILERHRLEELDDVAFQQVTDVILKGTYLCSQAVYPIMQRQGSGKIVNISSISGKIGGAVSGKAPPGAQPSPEAQGRSGPAYAAAKGGVLAFTSWMAKDAGHFGITVNAICPGPIATEMTRGFEYPVENQPIARMGQPEDVGQAVVFLASQMSNFITGQALNVDGGIVMG